MALTRVRAGARMSRRGKLRTVLVVGGLPIALACASLPSSSGGRCTSTLPPDPRSLDELADSAGLSRDIAASWPSVKSRVVATIAYDSVGGLDTARVWSASMPDTAGHRLTGVLMAHAHRSAGEKERVYLFLGDEKGPRPRRVPSLRSCAPRLLHPEHLAARLSAEARSLGVTHMLQVWVLASVQANGLVNEVRIDRTAGDANVDEAARRVVAEAVFLPGRIEGVPVPLWTHFPVTFVVRR